MVFVLKKMAHGMRHFSQLGISKDLNFRQVPKWKIRFLQDFSKEGMPAWIQFIMDN